jgi:branched-subunit amino acid transport protein
MSAWLTIIGMGLATYLTRITMIVLVGRREVPGWAGRALRFVPVTVLPALVAPELLRPGGGWDFGLGNARLIAGLVAILVAWRTRSALLTIIIGMGLFWLMGALT